MLADDVGRRGIDQVPIVNAMRMIEVEVEHSAPREGVAILIPSDENQETREAVLVDWRSQKSFDLCQCQSEVLCHDSSQHRHADADELIVFRVFPFPRFEPNRSLGALGVGGPIERALQSGKSLSGFHTTADELAVRVLTKLFDSAGGRVGVAPSPRSVQRGADEGSRQSSLVGSVLNMTTR